MKVIGCGFGRTGTTSLKLALDQLGFGPTLHASEFGLGEDSYKLQMAWYRKVNGGGVPWSALLEGYQSAIDWPVAYYWRPLAEEYQDARFILTYRPALEWLESFKQTILPSVISQVESPRYNRGWTATIIGRLTFNEKVMFGELDFSDENLLRCYAKHIANVRAAFREQPDRLLEFNVKEGWEPLCRFLGVPVPGQQFPQANDAAEFKEKRHFVTGMPVPEMETRREVSLGQ